MPLLKIVVEQLALLVRVQKKEFPVGLSYRQYATFFVVKVRLILLLFYVKVVPVIWLKVAWLLSARRQVMLRVVQLLKLVPLTLPHKNVPRRSKTCPY
jgi:hypothetical protein